VPDLSSSLWSSCAPFAVGTGQVERTPGGARLILPRASRAGYSDAQFDDYADLSRRRFPHRPPLRLSLRARFSHNAGALKGTAGFGFWNAPQVDRMRVPSLFPQAIWFFFDSPPSNIALAFGVPGYGWKAACIDAGRRSAWPWAPIAVPVMLACRSPKLYRAIWPRAQRALAINERLIAWQEGHMTGWHTYGLEWRRDGARWQVDGRSVLETDRSPRGPLGFVAWIDNRYARVTPQGSIWFGLLDTPAQWMEIGEVELIRDA
jgi:hypothetical protein